MVQVHQQPHPTVPNLKVNISKSQAKKIHPGDLGGAAKGKNDRYNPEESKAMGRLPPKVTSNKVYGLNVTREILEWKRRDDKSAPTKPNDIPELPLRISMENNRYSTRQDKPDKGTGANAALHITKEEDETQPEDSIDAPSGLEEYVKAMVDELKEINIDNVEDPRPTYVSTLLTPEEEAMYVALLTKFRDVFSWTYSEMPGLNPKVVVHYLAIKKGSRPVKQCQHDSTLG
ncbi:hypothetical protein LIER_18242 [Lithospermum erythrorhizon]|uniref:Uncharacterized protein n=1 Tax=Lithospermum erythrorhizon TaxID=34254 RepID=A0AAV3QD78_LITER